MTRVDKSLDLSFLDEPLPRLSRRRQRVNLYEILGLVDSELAADRTLAFFLDPNERHGMQTALVDALLLTIDGQQLLSGTGRSGRTFDAQRFLGSTTWSVDRQVPAQEVDGESGLTWPGVIDIYVTNRELNIAIIIENKIWATLDNPLETYTRHAINEGYGTVLLTVLAPREHELTEVRERWASGTISYHSLLSALKARRSKDSSDVADRDRERSAAILEQFEEVRERSQEVTDYASEAEFIEAFRKALNGKEDSLAEFFDAQQRLNRLFRERSQKLRPLIDEQLVAGGLTTIWAAHSASVTNHWVYAWNAYQFENSKNTVELILDASPSRPFAITVKAYPGRNYKFYPDLDHAAIDVDWNSTDAEIVKAFVSKVVDIEKLHPGRS